MTREKKKLTYDQLEEHVLYWATQRIQDLQDISHRIYRDTSIPDEEKEFIYNGLAEHVSELIELMYPLRHDEENLMLWANEFVDEYATFDKSSYEG